MITSWKSEYVAKNVARFGMQSVKGKAQVLIV
jgi:hypothetical protein